MHILVLNAGSSSLKLSVFRAHASHGRGDREEVLAQGELQRIGSPEAQMTFARGNEEETLEPLQAESLTATVEVVLKRLSDMRFDAVGHRVVHGGPRFFNPVLIDDSVLGDIRRLVALAPLHNPSGIAGIETARRLLPSIPHVAVFDTAFHHDLPPIAATYALPLELSKRLGLRRYGFHGISYRYVSERLRLLVGRNSSRHIICHLGNGASVCALKDGTSIDTSMGFTPLEGLIMGTRSGNIDPGLLLHLQRTQGMTAEQVDDLLNHRSGLLGLSGRSADVRDLEAAGDESSNFALECFAYRITKYIGAYAAGLGGVDALVFTGGIGEFSPGIRTRICEKLSFLGLSLDEAGNHRATGKTVDKIGERVWVIPTDEERQIARETRALLN